LPEAVNQTANLLQNAVSQGTDEQLMASVDQEYNGIVQFVVKQAGQLFDSYAARAAMTLFEFVVFGVIVYSYGGFAVGAMLGPVMIPFALFGRTAGWFDRWLSAFVAFAMMRVVASIVVGISALFMHSVFAALPWWVWVTMLEKALLVLVAAAGGCIY